MRKSRKQITMGDMEKKSWFRIVWNKARRPLSFLPAVCVAVLIFGFSAQTGEESASLSSQVTETFVRTADRLTGAGWTEKEIMGKVAKYGVYIRKAAHMTEYAVFAAALMFPLWACGLKGKRAIFAVMLVCALCAAADEWHQSFVGGRGPSVRDVGIDCIGAVAGTVAAGLILLRRERKKKSPEK